MPPCQYVDGKAPETVDSVDEMNGSRRVHAAWMRRAASVFARRKEPGRAPWGDGARPVERCGTTPSPFAG